MASTYRLFRKTRVVVTKNGKPDILTIPEGSIITLAEPPAKETGLMPVKWESMTVKMFAEDPEHRPEPLD